MKLAVRDAATVRKLAHAVEREAGILAGVRPLWQGDLFGLPHFDPPAYLHIYAEAARKVCCEAQRS